MRRPSAPVLEVFYETTSILNLLSLVLSFKVLLYAPRISQLGERNFSFSDGPLHERRTEYSSNP